MTKVNIKYLAAQLNMAPSTVSRALNDSYEISHATKAKVLALAKKLNYQPNPYARSLRAHSSKTIGVIIPERINNFFSQVIDGLESITQEYGYHLLVYNSHEDVEQEKKIISYLLGGRVDAIVMSVSSQTSDTQHLAQVQSQGIPIIFFDRIAQDIPTTKFTTNDFESGYLGTKHLLEQGCRKVFFLLLSKEITIGRERMKGYQKAIEESDLDFSEDWIIQCHQDENQNLELFKSLIYPIHRPDGIISSVEKLAITAYHAIRQTKLRIPEDIRLVSFSNMKIADLLQPPLTTISQPAHEIGVQCGQLLMKKLIKKNQPDLPNTLITIPSTIQVRTSSFLKP
ncbi:LacI family DNA-binding transcriptional regulator [Arthrospiribacter ruber]|uniref:LacI family transcriptional regulator n=1 Tax=Arthrospiribacter ruber TaxID=2487934 RepID=A0A951IXV2_9BACT|nr:LacI family DNA-binding transcriptional regulator [Arthrospiribacter ruber]MBW3468109.1 LacI family transcriptional regulator [Arthrospiribacter ruber]